MNSLNPLPLIKLDNTYIMKTMWQDLLMRMKDTWNSCLEVMNLSNHQWENDFMITLNKLLNSIFNINSKYK